MGFTFNTTNIDARKKTELKLKQSGTMLKALYDSASEAISFLDNNFRIIFTNRISKEICKKKFGIEPAIGESILDYIVPEFKNDFIEYHQQVLQGKSIFVEKEHMGSWWAFTITPVYDSENNIIGISDNVRDITKRKNRELKIIRQNEMLNAIAWQQSHELRRPVANILGLCESLKNYKNETEEMQNQLIDFILQSTQELDSIIREIVLKANHIKDTGKD